MAQWPTIIKVPVLSMISCWHFIPTSHIQNKHNKTTIFPTAQLKKYTAATLSSYPQSPNASSGNQLTVVDLNPLQRLATHQMFQGRVSYKWAVVQLQNLQMFHCAWAGANLSDTFICDQLTMWQGLAEVEHIIIMSVLHKWGHYSYK